MTVEEVIDKLQEYKDMYGVNTRVVFGNKDKAIGIAHIEIGIMSYLAVGDQEKTIILNPGRQHEPRTKTIRS